MIQSIGAYEAKSTRMPYNEPQFCMICDFEHVPRQTWSTNETLMTNS